MALSRTQKQGIVEQYETGIASAPHAFLLDFKGVTVTQATELRTQIRDRGGNYEVVKNTLALRAAEGKPLGELSEYFQGPTAVAYTEDDPVGLAKALTDFAKTVPAIEFKGGLLDSQAVAPEAIQDIAQMPSRDELIAKLLFLLQSPVTRFVRGLVGHQPRLRCGARSDRAKEGRLSGASCSTNRVQLTEINENLALLLPGAREENATRQNEWIPGRGDLRRQKWRLRPKTSSSRSTR